MNPVARSLLFFSCLLSFSACSQMPNMPNIFWDSENAQYEPDHADAGVKPVKPPEISPELHTNRTLPMAGDIAAAASADKLPEKYRRLLAGHDFTLEKRSYEPPVADLFSAIIDAMTSLNIPVQSVDSRHGIVTSDWLRKGENDLNMPGIRGYTRHRFIISVVPVGAEFSMEVRTIGQIFKQKHWMDKRLRRNASLELFIAVDEQLTRVKATAFPIKGL